MSIEHRERKRKTAKGAEGQYDDENKPSGSSLADGGLQTASFGSVEVPSSLPATSPFIDCHDLEDLDNMWFAVTDTGALANEYRARKRELKTADARAKLPAGVPDVKVENLGEFTARLTKELAAQYPDADLADVQDNAKFQAYDRYFTALNESAKNGDQVTTDMQEGLSEGNRRYLQDNYPNVVNDPNTPEKFQAVGKTRSVWSWDDLDSLPNETFVNVEDRKATTKYLMHDDGNGHQVFAELTTYNSRESKSMCNTVTVFRQEKRNGFDVKTYEPFADSLVVRKTPLARYSEKALIASHDTLIFDLQDYMGDHSSNPRATKALLDVFLRGFEKGNDLEDEA